MAGQGIVEAVRVLRECPHLRHPPSQNRDMGHPIFGFQFKSGPPAFHLDVSRLVFVVDFNRASR
jgi:hypothetical protein